MQHNFAGKTQSHGVVGPHDMRTRGEIAGEREKTEKKGRKKQKKSSHKRSRSDKTRRLSSNFGRVQVLQLLQRVAATHVYALHLLAQGVLDLVLGEGCERAQQLLLALLMKERRVMSLADFCVPSVRRRSLPSGGVRTLLTFGAVVAPTLRLAFRWLSIFTTYPAVDLEVRGFRRSGGDSGAKKHGSPDLSSAAWCIYSETRIFPWKLVMVIGDASEPDSSRKLSTATLRLKRLLALTLSPPSPSLACLVRKQSASIAQPPRLFLSVLENKKGTRRTAGCLPHRVELACRFSSP